MTLIGLKHQKVSIKERNKMVKPLKSGVVNLSDEAKNSGLFMLKNLLKNESELKVDHSRLISFIVNDYKERFFFKNINKILSAHRDSKKQIKNKLSDLNESQLQALSKALQKIELEDNKKSQTKVNNFVS